MELKQIAHIESDFPEKFGIPRQPGLVKGLQATVVFEEGYRDPAALSGLEEFEYIWLIWGFSAIGEDEWASTVHPPKLGGNVKKGVFATRSPFRPNHIGLSSVRLAGIEKTADRGTVLKVLGADLMDGTPIYDVKPYVRYSDAHPDAKSGFSDSFSEEHLDVVFPEELLRLVPEEKREALEGVLSQDPRPSYQEDPDRLYGVAFGKQNIRFRVCRGVLTVVDVEPFTADSAAETMRRNEETRKQKEGNV